MLFCYKNKVRGNCVYIWIYRHDLRAIKHILYSFWDSGMIERIKNYCQASSLFEEKFDKRYYYTLFMSLDRDCECLDVDNGTKKTTKNNQTNNLKKKGKKKGRNKA